MRLVVIIAANILIVGLFFYSKLLPYKDRLNPKYKRIFNSVSSLLLPVLNFLKRFFKPFQVGQGISVDTTQIILLILFLLILNII
jgi:hypothetical protein